MRIVQRKNIDVKLWDEKIENSPLQNPFIHSWALNATATDWWAVVNDDYSFLLPLPIDNKWGVKRVRQHYFSRQLDWIGSENQFQQALVLVKKQFKEFDFGVSLTTSIEKTKRFQWLNYAEEIMYSKNTKRILKKKHFEVVEKKEVEKFLEIYKNNAFQKFKQPTENLYRLERLIEVVFSKNKAKMFVIEEDNEVKAAAIFIDYKTTRTYLIGDATPEMKKKGAIFYLLDYGIQNAPNNCEIFDFGGSNVDSVANFYKKMGGKDSFYSHVHWENYPFWFSLLKRLKR